MTILRFLEDLRNPVLDWFHQIVTYFGEQVVILILVMVIYWCIDRKKGIFLMYVLVTGSALNNLLKGIFCIPRPWVRDPEFTIVESAREGAGGYSFPSGHTQAAAACYLGIAWTTKNVKLKVAMVVLTFLVALSRMHLGVHTPLDVSVAIVLSLLLVFVSYRIFKKWEDEPKKWMLPLYLFLAAVCAAQLIQQSFFPQRETADPVNSAHALETAYKVTGLAIGMIAGVYLEETKIRFRTDAVWWAQIMKMAIGLLGFLALQKGLKPVLTALTGGHPAAHTIRYSLVAFWGAGIWPMLFRFLPGTCQESLEPIETKEEEEE